MAGRQEEAPNVNVSTDQFRTGYQGMCEENSNESDSDYVPYADANCE